MFDKHLFQGQRILITGGGTGLGLGMAHTLALLNPHLWPPAGGAAGRRR